MDARMRRLQTELALDRAAPALDASAIRRRVNAGLNADPSERKTYMRQKIRFAAVLIAAILALTGAALAVGGNWDAVVRALGSFTPYAQEVAGVSATDGGLRVSVEAALSDKGYTTAYVSVTDLTGDRLSEGTVYNGYIGNECVSYDPETRTALFAIPLWQRDFNDDGTVTLVFRSFQPGMKKLFGLGLSDDALSGETRESRLLTEAEREGNRWNSGTEPVVLLPDQNPSALEGTDLIWISSSGFDGNGVYHVLFETADGMTCESSPMPYLSFDDREAPSSYHVNTLRFGDGRYLDVSYPDRVTRENFPHLVLNKKETPDSGHVDALLYTVGPIRGDWTLTFTPETLPERSLAISDTLSGMELTRVGLTSISLRLELTSAGGTPAYYPMSVFLADGSRIDFTGWADIEDVDSERSMEKVVLEDGSVMYRVDASKEEPSRRHFAVTWSFPAPIDPEQVVGFSLGYRMYPISGDSAGPGSWLDKLPTE